MSVRIKNDLPDDHRLASARGMIGEIEENISENEETRAQYAYEFYPKDGEENFFYFVNLDEIQTDHSAEISALRERASDIAKYMDLPNSGAFFRRDYNMLEAAAALLEVHDSTGISLDNWTGPRDFVEDLIGTPITENHV